MRIPIFLIFAWTTTASAYDFLDKSRSAISELPYGEIKQLVQSPEALEKFIESQRDQKTSALLIVKDGKMYVEKYWDIDAYQPVLMHSITKSVTSLLIGKLVDDGKLSVQDKAKKWFPEWTGDKEQITVQQLLNQTAGLPPVAKENLKSTDRLQQAKLEGLVVKPGSEFKYSNGGAYLLGDIIRQETKDAADAFANRILFQPLGITKWDWSKDPTNHVNTSGGLSLTARDLIKTGVLMLNEGKWSGSQIVSAKYIHEATDWNGSSNYGYMFWTRENVYYARGDFGQIMAVYPQKKVVVVRLRKTESLSEAESPAGRWDENLKDLGSMLKK